MADDDDSAAGLTSTAPSDKSGTGGSDSASADAAKPRQRRRAVRRAGSPEGASSQRSAEMNVPKPETSAGSTDASGAPEDKTEKKADKKAKKEKGRKRSPLAGRSKKSLVIGGVAGLLVVALIVAAVFLAVERYQAEKYNENRQAYLDAAKQAVLNLTTIHPETAAEDVTRIIEGSTGPFRADFESRKDPFISVIQESQVRTDGEIVAAAVEKQSDELATLLVAAKTTVSSVDQPEPSPRNFRMRVTIVDQDGKLKASKVEFVP